MMGRYFSFSSILQGRLKILKELLLITFIQKSEVLQYKTDNKKVGGLKKQEHETKG